MKIIKWNESYAVVLPIQIVRAFGWKVGTKLKAKITGTKKIELVEEKEK